MDRGYCLKWNKYGTVFQSSFLNLFASQELTDMTFVIDGEFIKCHRIIISAASSYFRNILVNLKEPNPVIVLNDISYSTFRALIDFIYCGEIEVHQSFLGAVVRAGEKYCIEGLKESEESLVNHSLPDEPMNISGEPCPKMYKYNINRDFEEEVENEQNLTSHHEIDETYEEDEQRKAITVDIGQSTLDDPAAVKEETHLVEEESLVQESETNLSVVENPDASSSVYSQDISFSTPVYGQELQSNDHSGEPSEAVQTIIQERLLTRIPTSRGGNFIFADGYSYRVKSETSTATYLICREFGCTARAVIKKSTNSFQVSKGHQGSHGDWFKAGPRKRIRRAKKTLIKKDFQDEKGELHKPNKMLANTGIPRIAMDNWLYLGSGQAPSLPNFVPL
ncbi:longitudinals lacking protein, isoforms H/M/V-like isoform X2 [Artemia franciscana]|uniref:longitudinals lacking protein, isoforms H/M/V-like isoform X2 n=1 Tax=Artemia franciscana TaxID=6661 RepID=UPI0032DADD47